MATSQSIAERFWSKVEKTATCWLWRAARDRDGYGAFRIGHRTVRAHRWAYEQLVGPIPEGLEPDHLCRNHACVNPDHLEPVTHKENLRRGIRGVLTTHCPHGHAYAGANLYVDPGGHRECRTCRSEQVRRCRARKKERSEQ